MSGRRGPRVSRKRDKPDEIVGKLRRADVLHSQGLSMSGPIRHLSVREVTVDRWREEYGGMSGDPLRRMKDLEREPGQFRRAVSDPFLNKQILMKATRETSEHLAPPPVYRSSS